MFALFSELSLLVMPDPLNPVDCSPPGSSVHGNSLGKNTGVCCHALLQGIFPTQGLNPALNTLQVDCLPSEPPGKPNRCLKYFIKNTFFSKIGKTSVKFFRLHNLFKASNILILLQQ